MLLRQPHMLSSSEFASAASLGAMSAPLLGSFNITIEICWIYIICLRLNVHGVSFLVIVGLLWMCECAVAQICCLCRRLLICVCTKYMCAMWCLCTSRSQWAERGQRGAWRLPNTKCIHIYIYAVRISRWLSHCIHVWRRSHLSCLNTHFVW